MRLPIVARSAGPPGAEVAHGHESPDEGPLGEQSHRATSLALSLLSNTVQNHRLTGRTAHSGPAGPSHSCRILRCVRFVYAVEHLF